MPEALVRAWVLGLDARLKADGVPADEVVHDVCLLGTKEDGRREIADFYALPGHDERSELEGLLNAHAGRRRFAIHSLPAPAALHARATRRRVRWARRPRPPSRSRLRAVPRRPRPTVGTIAAPQSPSLPGRPRTFPDGEDRFPGRIRGFPGGRPSLPARRWSHRHHSGSRSGRKRDLRDRASGLGGRPGRFTAVREAWPAAREAWSAAREGPRPKREGSAAAREGSRPEREGAKDAKDARDARRKEGGDGPCGAGGRPAMRRAWTPKLTPLHPQYSLGALGALGVLGAPLALCPSAPRPCEPAGGRRARRMGPYAALVSTSRSTAPTRAGRSVSGTDAIARG